MKNIRNCVERGFENFAHFLYRHRIKTVVIMLLLLGTVISQIPKITIDTSTEGFLHENDPTLLAYNAFRDQFGRDEVIIIAIESPNIFSQAFLKKLKTVQEDLEQNVPYIDDITSLVNARNTRGEANELVVEDLLEDWPQNETEMAVLKDRVISNPLYKNLLISEDGEFTAIVIKTQSYSGLVQDADVLEGVDDNLMQTPASTGPDPIRKLYLTDKENSLVVTAVKHILQKYRAPDFLVYVVGSPVVTHFLKRTMMNDMRKFVVLAIVTVAVFLYLMFRRITGVLLPLTIVGVSLLCTVGIMAILKVPIKVPTQILPSFLLAVGVGTSVHILAIFFHRFDENMDKEAAIAYALGHSGLAVLMTNVTTASGLLSFSTSEVAPIADIGIFAGIGVMLAFVTTIVLLPALLALFPIKYKRKSERDQKVTVMDRFLSRVSHFSTSHPVAIVVAGATILVLSVVGTSWIRFSHHILGWFPETNEIRMATEKIDHEMRGTLNLEIVIDTGKENGLYEPDLLNRLENAATYVQSLEYQDVFVGKAWSLTTILKEINQALNENRPAYYAIPDDRDLIAQEFLLFENSGSDDLEDFVDSQFAMVRFSVKAPFKDVVKYNSFLQTIHQYFADSFPDTKITFTGMMTLLSRTISNAIRSMARSYVIALVVITILMVILIGRVRIGLLSMIPNLAPILLMLGVIGATAVPMDLFTMMVGSIAIGLAVDDTIHFMHNFRRYYEQSGDPNQAVFKTLHTTGRAMLVTTVVLSLGFFIFVFASMNNLFYFGLLTSFTIVMALVADYLLAPALMVLVNKPKRIPAEDKK